MSQRALIVIDIQNDYFPGGKWTVDGMTQAAANAARLIADARDKGDKIVHVRHEIPSDTAPFFVPGSQGAQIHASVAPKAGETVIVKNHANSFRDTDLKNILDASGVRDVVICGAMSQMCIDGTARAAADSGYGVTLVDDACAARAMEFDGTSVPAAQVHAAFMAALGSSYARTVKTDTHLSG
jgi:nicotinamidase-related amidase